MRGPRLVLVALVFMLSVQGVAAVGPASGEGRVASPVQLHGNLSSSFDAGAILVEPPTMADGLELLLTASLLYVEFNAVRWWEVAERDGIVPVGTEDWTTEPFEEEFKFTSARLTLPDMDTEDGPQLLLFPRVDDWSQGASGGSFRVSTPDADATLATATSGEPLIIPPMEAKNEAMDTPGGWFRQSLPVDAFTSGKSAHQGYVHLLADGMMRLYLWGFVVNVESAEGPETFHTGIGELENHGGVARYREFSYVMVTVNVNDARLEARTTSRSTAWYAPEPEMNVVGAMAAEWLDANMRAGERRYEADGVASLQGSFSLSPRAGDEGTHLAWEGDVTETSFRVAASSATLPVAPNLATIVQIGLLVLVLTGALAFARWRKRDLPATLPTVRAPVGKPPIVAPVPSGAAPLVTLRPAAPSPPPPAPTGTTKDNVLRLIERKPGIHLASAATELRIPRSIAFHHVHDLERRGLVFSVPVQGRYALFRVGQWVPEDANGQAALTSPRTREVALLLLEKPGITIGTLVERTKMPARSVARELQRLRARGLALRDMLARPAKYHPSERLRRLADREAAPQRIEPEPQPLSLPVPTMTVNGHNGDTPPATVVHAVN